MLLEFHALSDHLFILVFVCLDSKHFLFGYIHILVNEIDGDAFVLLTSDAMKSMINKQGVLLKFQHKFNQLHSSSSVSDKVDSNNLVSKEQEIQVVKERSDRTKQRGLTLDAIREESKILDLKENHHKLAKGSERCCLFY